MRKIIATINLTLDGYCDHTVLAADEEIHDHYTELLNGAGTILYGSITYELMKYWLPLVKNASGEAAMDDFARAIDQIPKIVFSHLMQTTGWDSAVVADRPIEEEVAVLQRQPGRDILVGSRSLILQLMQLNLIDEYQLCMHPVVAGRGLPLFENINDRTVLQLIKTKSFGGGTVLLYYGRGRMKG